MAGKFKKGDICVIIHCPANPELVGEETTLLSDYCEIFCNKGNFMGYAIDLTYNGHNKLAAPEHCLKLRSSPAGTTGEEDILALFDGRPMKVPEESYNTNKEVEKT